MNNYFMQAPDEFRLYQQLVKGDTIVSVVWSLTPSESVEIGIPLNSTDTTTVMISGLTVGTRYNGLVHIVCGSTQQIDAAFTILCEDASSPQ